MGTNEASSWRRVLLYAWFAGVVLASCMPVSWKVRLRTTGSLHLPLHFAVFAFPGILDFRFFFPNRAGTLRAMAVIGLALFLEILEALIAHNPIEWRDIAADIAGVVTAMLISSLVYRRR